MQNKRKLILLAVAFVLIIAIAVLSYDYLSDKYNIDETDTASKAATKAPDFTVQDIDGNTVRFSDFVGSPIILNFWASWCGPCAAEMPEFDKLYKEVGSDVVFMMVNLTDGRRETVQSATAFIEKNGYSFPLFFDTEYSAATVYGVSSIPATVFIDSDGYVRSSYLGTMDEDTLRSKLRLIYSD